MARKGYWQPWFFGCLLFLFKRSSLFLYPGLGIAVEQGFVITGNVSRALPKDEMGINKSLHCPVSQQNSSKYHYLYRMGEESEQTRSLKNVSQAREGPLSTPQVVQMSCDPNATGCSAKFHTGAPGVRCLSYSFGNHLRKHSDLLLNSPHVRCATCLAQRTHCTSFATAPWHGSWDHVLEKQDSRRGYGFHSQTANSSPASSTASWQLCDLGKVEGTSLGLCFLICKVGQRIGLP